MFAIVTIVHVMVALFLVIVVLLQTGKRADLAGAFGGGGSQTAFGARGAASVLSKATTYSAMIFMATSLLLSILSGRHSGGTGSVLDSVPAPATKSAPAASKPAAPAPVAPAPAPPAPAPAAPSK